MVLSSAGVAGPRPSNASEDKVLTSWDKRCVLKLGGVAAAAAVHVVSARTTASNDFT
jgi:hypothetical protein